MVDEWVWLVSGCGQCGVYFLRVGVVSVEFIS